MATSFSTVRPIIPTTHRGPSATRSTATPPSATPSVSMTTASRDHVTISAATIGTVTVDSDIFVMLGNGRAGVALGGAGETVRFVGMTELSLAGSSASGAREVVTADTGTNTFIAGTGAMKVTDGSGANTYIVKSGSGPITIDHFSVATGDRLMIGVSLRNSMRIDPDGAGGTLISFAGAGSIDLKSVATLPSSAIGFVAIDPLPVGFTATPPTPTSSASLTTVHGDHVTIDGATVGTVTVGSDTFSMHGNGGAGVALGGAGETLRFVGMSQLSLTGSSATEVVTTDAGTNTFIAGTGAMEVTGGGGADAYIFNAGSGSLTIDDFSAAKGDRLTIAANLQPSMTPSTDGAGGTLISFAGAGSIDLKSVATLPSSAIGFVAVDPLPPFLK